MRSCWVGSVRIGHQSSGNLLLSVSLRSAHPARHSTGERDLTSKYRWQPYGFGSLGEPDHTIKSVVISDGQRFKAEARCFGDQLFGV
jgi:hypothetical protein